MTNALLDLVSSKSVVCADGGFATHLEDALGAWLGDSPVWSASVLQDSPQLIRQTHLHFLTAGAEIIGTATYQACHAGFAACGVDAAQAESLMRLAIDLADEARSSFLSTPDAASTERPLIALSLGPYGAYLRGGAEYTGDYDNASAADLTKFHLERLRVFADSPQTWSKIDIITFETVPRLDEAEAILAAVEELYDGSTSAADVERKAVYISFVFPEGRSLPVAQPGTDLDSAEGLKALVELLSPRPTWALSGIGINCTKLKYLSPLVTELTARLDRKLEEDSSIKATLFLEPDGGLVYDGISRTWSTPTAEEGQDDGKSSIGRWEAGLTGLLTPTAKSGSVSPWVGIVLGGCCKASTVHIRALRDALDTLRP
ncbi:hypothetical protein V8E36_005837 [Tilletia maclaganii]